MNLTWKDLLARTPELAELEREAVAANRDDLPWFDYLAMHQAELRRLVGYGPQNSLLRGTDVFGVALRHLATVWGATGRTGNHGPGAPHGRPCAVVGESGAAQGGDESSLLA